MINQVEDITPSAFRDVVLATSLNGVNAFEIQTDSDLYEHSWLMHFRGNGTFRPYMTINSVSPTYNNRTDIKNTFSGAAQGLHSASSLSLFDHNSITSAISTGRFFTKDDEATKVLFYKQYATGSTGSTSYESQSNWYPFPNTKITSFGFENSEVGTGDVLIRVFRWPRGLPLNYGDTMFSGDLTNDKLLTIDPVKYQSIGYEWCGTTGYKLDVDNQEGTNAYHQGSIRNATTTSGAPPALSTDQDLISSNNTHASGSLNDIPNTRNTLNTLGGSRSYNPSIELAKYEPNADNSQEIKAVEFKENGTIDGRLDIQRNIIYPYFHAPLHFISDKTLDSYDLSTQLDLPFSKGYSFILYRVMLSCSGANTLVTRVNNDTVGYKDGYMGHSGNSHTGNTLVTRDYLSKVSIGNSTVGNSVTGIIPVKAINGHHTCIHTDPNIEDQSREYVTTYAEALDITSIQFHTELSNLVTGKVQVFGIL